MPAQVEPGGQLPVYPYYNYVIAPREETRQVREEERRDERVELEMRPEQAPSPESAEPSQVMDRAPRRVEASDQEEQQQQQQSQEQQENKQVAEEDRARHVDAYA